MLHHRHQLMRDKTPPNGRQHCTARSSKLDNHQQHGNSYHPNKFEAWGVQYEAGGKVEQQNSLL